MVPLGDDLQGGSNQGGKALSDIQVPSLRFRQLATQGSNHLVKEGACGSVEPKPSWSSNVLVHEVKYVQGSRVTSAFDCSLSNNQGICVQPAITGTAQARQAHRYSYVLNGILFR